jgi:hypothetical protein
MSLKMRDIRASVRARRPLYRAAWAAMLLLPSAVAAQEIDAGQLQVREGGRSVGVERFRIWSAGGSVNAVATIDRGREPEWQVGIQLNDDWLPIKYELREARVPTVSAERLPDRVRFHMVSDSGERWKEFPARTVEGILETGVLHHLYVLVRRFQSAGLSTAQIVIPTTGLTATARLTAQQPDQVTLGDRTVAATRFDVDVGGVSWQVWIDADGRLLRVLDTGTGREAIQLPTRG